MEASLIGKALDFGSRECGFEPRVSKSLRYNSNAFLINHINFVISSRKRWCFCRFTKKIKKNLFLFRELGLLNSYFIYPRSSTKMFVLPQWKTQILRRNELPQSTFNWILVLPKIAGFVNISFLSLWDLGESLFSPVRGHSRKLMWAPRRNLDEIINLFIVISKAINIS